MNLGELLSADKEPGRAKTLEKEDIGQLVGGWRSEMTSR